MPRTVLSTDFNGDVFVFVKIDPGVADSKQLSKQRHKCVDSIHIRVQLLLESIILDTTFLR